nr:uncharacterized protein LOC129264370 isoform X1 [Lytechinus pictus]
MRLTLQKLIYGWLVVCAYLSVKPVTAIYSAQCGKYTYIPTLQTCCGGRVHSTPVALGMEFRCCGDDLYPMDNTWQCCGNKKMELREDAVCCNNEIINSTTHECCGDQQTSQLQHPKQQGHECCGTSYYDKERQTCCSQDRYSPLVADGVGSCCGSRTYDASSEICCPLPTGGMESHVVGKYGVLLRETECCGAGWINKTTHICCQGEAHPRGHGPASCHGNQPYDPTRQVECGGRLHDIQDGKTECCHGNLINPNDEPCCNDPALLQKSPFSCCGYRYGREIYDPTQSSCVGGIRTEYPEVKGQNDLWGLCDGSRYASTLHICCGGHLSTKFDDSRCCGSKSYRYKEQFCIDGSIVVDKVASNAEICTTSGREMDLQYDPETQTCCMESWESQYWRVFNGTEGECCLLSQTEVVFTDPTSETCCKAGEHQKVHPVPRGEGECCGPEMIVQGKQLCDDAMQEVVDIPENRTHDKVCVPLDREHNNIRQTYDSNREFCSDNGEIIPRAEGKDLCGGQIYDTDTHGCCGSRIYRLVTQQCCEYSIQPRVNDEGLPLECCGLQAYHSVTSTCFYGTIKDGIPHNNARLCGSEVYDNSRYDCVNGRDLVPQEAGPHIRLCGRMREVYDKRDQECCGEHLIGRGQTCCHGIQYQTPGTSLKEGQCCGSIGFNPSTHSCCMGSLTPTSGMEDPACCLDQAYDRSVLNITCCGGKLSRKAEEETECSMADGVVHRLDEIVCNGVRHPAGQGQCCGSNLYDPTTELCCDGFRYEAEENSVCCGNKPYQANGSHLCCNGTLHTQAEGKECCNRAAFYPSTHQCFSTGGQNIIIQLLDDHTLSATNAFCIEGSYNATNQTCCDGLLHNGLRECCSNRVIKAPSQEICCNGAIHQKIYGEESQCCPSGQIMHQSLGCNPYHSDFGHQLCNDTEFFPLTQGCCAGMVYSLSDAQCRDDKVFFLCGEDFYSPDEQTCCNGSLTDIPNGQCCQNTAYDPTSKICCQGYVRRIRRGRNQCCGALAFDFNKEMCCASGPTRKPRTKQKLQKLDNGNCCKRGLQPNFTTGYCEAIPLVCMGLEGGSLWKEASDDCGRDFTFSFIARHIDTNDTHTTIELDVVHHILPHNSNVELNTLVLPADTECRKLKEGEKYIVLSAGDVEDTSLLLTKQDFLGNYHTRIVQRLFRRTCI